MTRGEGGRCGMSDPLQRTMGLAVLIHVCIFICGLTEMVQSLQMEHN